VYWQGAKTCWRGKDQASIRERVRNTGWPSVRSAGVRATALPSQAVCRIWARKSLTLRLSVVDCAPGSSAAPSARCASDPVSINPDSLLAAKNQQNRIAEYRDMLRAWKRIRAVIWAGDIIGFPADTPATAMRDIRIIPHELPIDFLEFFVLTPLPGSEDHQARRPQTIARQTVARGLVYICRNRHLERAARRQRRRRPGHQAAGHTAAQRQTHRPASPTDT
jgi:hypothetical protein